MKINENEPSAFPDGSISMVVPCVPQGVID